MKIIVATKNKGKIKEIKKILAGHDVVSQGEAGIDIDVEENGTTFAENAMIKASAIAKRCDCAVIADDSGIEVDALGGAPGIYSARYCGENATDEDRVIKLLDEVKDKDNRGAQFKCAIALILPDGEKHIFEGIVRGTLDFEVRGQNGFGYDPIFIPDGYDKTFGELDSSIKDRISHRAKALMALADFMNKNGMIK